MEKSELLETSWRGQAVEPDLLGELEKQKLYREDQARDKSGKFEDEGKGDRDIGEASHAADDEAYVVSIGSDTDSAGRYDVRTKSGREFLSPNTTDMTFDDAVSAMKGDGQRLARLATVHIDGQIGIEGNESYDGIGDWSDGAENSVVSEVSGFDDFDQLRYSAALKGKLLNQKAVLAFQVGEGNDTVYDTFINSTDLEDIRGQLTKAGIQFRTILPSGDKTHIVVFDQGNKLKDNIEQFANHYDSIVSAQRGTGEFVGESDTREGAVKNYDAIIRSYEEKFPNRGHYKPAQGQGADDHGGKIREDTGGAAPKVGEPFLVYRLGRGNPLSNDNAGNAQAVASHLMNVDNPEAPQPAGGTGDRVAVYKIVPHEEWGPYRGFVSGRAENYSDAPIIGRGVDGAIVVYSFPKGGKFTAEKIAEVPVTKIRDKLRELHGADNFDDAGELAGAEAIRAVFKDHKG